MRPDVALALGLFWAGGVPQLARCGVRGLMPRLGRERVIDLGGGFGAGPQDLDRLLAIRLDKLFGGLFDRRRGVAHTLLTWVNEARSADPERFQAIGALARGARVSDGIAGVPLSRALGRARCAPRRAPRPPRRPG